eukprot:TRINITY_DN42781_c0_g1_i1.p1 TRINITY_DN42781_c0_g1~~TRINITY_DN42781_c0_g1_i1.p1  ORF type:complete len:529 (+),score=120.84 TRINITY_DN42781_c0_g1_i1:30-1589(+)
MGKGGWQEQGAWQAPVEQISKEKKQEIVEFLQSKGGFTSAAAIGGRFKLSTASLQAAGFVFSEADANGQRQITIKGSAKQEEKQPAQVGGNVVFDIIEYLANNDDCARTSLICRMFDVSIQQLSDEGFVIGAGNNQGQSNVASPGNAEPDPPGDWEVPVQDLIAYLEGNGGFAPIAEIGSLCKVKRGDLLAAGFVVGPGNSTGQCNVAPPGYPPPAAPACASRGFGGASAAPHAGAAAVQRFQAARPHAVTPVQRSGSLRDQIVAHLREAGGYAPVAVIGSAFKVKRAQLEAMGFSFGATDANTGQANVGLPGSRAPPAGAAAPPKVGTMQASSAKRPAPPGFPPAPAVGAKRVALHAANTGNTQQSARTMHPNGKAGQPANAFAAARPNALLQTLQAAGYGDAALTQLASAIQSTIGQGNVGKGKGMIPPKPEVPAKPRVAIQQVNPYKVPAKPQASNQQMVSYKVFQEIASFIKEEGGAAPLARLGSKFMVKKDQLEEAGFSISPPDHNGQRQVALA